MENCNALYKELERAGKLQKLTIYAQIIKYQWKDSPQKAIDSFNSALKIYQSYLDFDPAPPAEVNKNMLKLFLLVFGLCRKINSSQLFDQIYPEFKNHLSNFQDALLLARIYSHLNYLFWMKNNPSKSLDYGHKCLEMLEYCGNDNILLGRYSNIGYLYECLADYQKAEEFYQKGIQYGLKINSDQVLCLAYCGFGRMNLRTANYSMSINYFLEALKFFPDQNDDYISVINNLGIACSSSGNHKEAIKYFSRFLNQNTQKKHPELYNDLLMNSANSYLALNQLDKAESHLTEALNYALPKKRFDIITGLIINLGNLEKKRGNWEKAIEYYKSSFNYNKDINDPQHNLVANLGLGSVYYSCHQFSLAQKFLSLALSEAKNLKSSSDLIAAHEILANIYEKENNYQKALIHTKQLKEIQLKENQKKFAQDFKQLKLKYQKKEKILSQYDSSTSLQLISRELSAKINSPLIGESQAIQTVVDHAFIAAQNPSTPVLITGESGTGKEIIARLIHYASTRSKNHFVSVNTAAFTDTLIESAFFGSEKGAYTGSEKLKIGYFEAAEKGSLFLDEIGDMPLNMQVKFLRVLENKIIHRIGSIQDIKLDFRLIAATHKDLYRVSENNQFRFDLLNRINAIEINIPPLRERREDIPLLITYFLEFFASKLNIEKPMISSNALKMLISHDYPGNVRELKNTIRRILMFSKKNIIHSADIMFSLHNQHNSQHLEQKNLNLKDNEVLLIKKAMDKCNQVQLHAAKLLGISPYALNRKLKKMAE